MGCISSKQGVSVTPAFDYSGGGFRDNGGSSGVLGSWHQHRAEDEGEKMKKKNRADSCGGGDSRRTKSSKVGESLSWRLGKYVQGEQVAAGWPAWLSAVGAEAIQGWIPLRADSFEKLDKIGQGTYSSVFRARDLDSGNIVALKKVRFDNFEPESVRFMTREIMILRRLEHPNIIKLLGLITSRLSCSIYLVFEYMEHDLAGLSTCPDIKFSESQIKCYMQQLLSGLEHCHSRGIMHRDIKGSNLLVNNEGILKIADFGLANFFSSGNRQPLTSRVVTLWYRPPELLLGSTSYGPSVDLWSVGCVFGELYLGKPILQGRTEVEQLHKIFKLCGSPPDEYWKKSRLPHATIFKPQHPYERALPDVCKEFPSNALQLIENFLSVEPYKRETASSALASEYFTTKPYACDPSTLPKYPPNKEIDAKFREEARRKKNGGRARGNEATRRPSKTSKPFRESNGLAKSASMVKEFPSNTQHSQNTNGDDTHLHKDIGARQYAELSKPPLDTKQEVSHKQSTSTEEECFSGPLHVSASSGFAWVKKRESGSFTSQSRSSSRGKVCIAIDPSDLQLTRNTSESQGCKNVEALYQTQTYSQDQDSCESTKHAIRKKWRQVDRPDSFDSSSMYHSHELPAEFYQNEHSDNGYNTGYQNQGDLVKFSGPLLSQSNTVDELLERHERHMRQAVRRSWMQRAKRQGR